MTEHDHNWHPPAPARKEQLEAAGLDRSRWPH